MDLPYAITYMQALSSTIVLYDIFRSVYEAEDLYGEVSRECGIIVRDVELFGEDLLSAMSDVIAITPSDKFKARGSSSTATLISFTLGRGCMTHRSARAFFIFSGVRM